MKTLLKSWTVIVIAAGMLSACSSHCTCPPQQPSTTIVTPGHD